MIINLDDLDFTTMVKGIKQPLVETTTLGNLRVKRSLVFKPMIDATNKSKKVFMDVMDCINSIQLDIDKKKQHNFKEHLDYLKERDRKAHK